jgi:hypothetical protein
MTRRRQGERQDRQVFSCGNRPAPFRKTGTLTPITISERRREENLRFPLPPAPLSLPIAVPRLATPWRGDLDPPLMDSDPSPAAVLRYGQTADSHDPSRLTGKKADIADAVREPLLRAALSQAAVHPLPFNRPHVS